MFFLKPQYADTMPNKGNKKAKVAEEDLDFEIMPRVEVIYEDTRSVTGAEMEFKWGKIYHMLQDQKFLDAGLEDLPLFGNILRTGITRVSMRPELFPCTEVIGWIFPEENARDMIIYNVEGKGFTSFTAAYIAKA